MWLAVQKERREPSLAQLGREPAPSVPEQLPPKQPSTERSALASPVAEPVPALISRPAERQSRVLPTRRVRRK